MTNIDSQTESSELKDDRKTKLEQITHTKKQLAQIKEDLNKIIDAMLHNPSLFSRAAKFWGNVPLWQKIIAGLIITLPLLLIGIFLQIALLLAISLVITVAYTAGSILLDDHQSQISNNTEQLRIGISSLADTLSTIISSLDILREQLAFEIEQFKKENKELGLQLTELKGQVNEFKSQVILFQNTEQQLRSFLNELQNTNSSLKLSIKEQSALLKKTHTELEQSVKKYEESQQQLSEKVVELKQVKVEMELAVKKANTIAKTLQGTVKTLTSTVITDKNQRADFQKRLEDFLSDKEKSFDQIADRISEAERQLAIVKEELNSSNQRYQELLNRQEEQVIRLEGINGQTHDSTNKMGPESIPAGEIDAQNTANLTGALKKLGFYVSKAPLARNDLSNEQTLRAVDI